VTTNIPAPRRRTRVQTIVWGAILLAVAVFALIALLGSSLGSTTVLWSLVGFGGVLVLAAVVSAVVRAVNSRGGEHPPIG
jgi:uncharacterized membrane protein YeiB